MTTGRTCRVNVFDLLLFLSCKKNTFIPNTIPTEYLLKEKGKYEGHLVGEWEADRLPPLDGDGDDQEDGGGEGEVTRALQDGKHEADVVNLGSIIH